MTYAEIKAHLHTHIIIIIIIIIKDIYIAANAL